MIGEKFVRKELDLILHLPLVERITHRKFRRPLIAMVLGTTVMLLASILSTSADYVTHNVNVPHFMVDAFAYFAHGLGAIPFVRYIEPLWVVLMGAAAE